MTQISGPLETALQEIEKALAANLFYLALVMALTLPDICAALEDENAYSGRDEYKKWYRENLADRFPFMSDADCYSLRCGVVHKGSLGLKSKGSTFSRVLFALPTPRRNIFHNNVLNDALQFDPVIFCADMIAAVRKWYSEHCEDENVKKNLPNVLQVRPNGLAPYMVGTPIIA
jgi:hypothetical protein